MLSREGRTGRGRRVLVFWMLALLWTCGVYADTFGDFTYTTNSTSATITGYTGAGGDVVIPDALGGKPVTKISTKLFYSRKGLTSVTIPASMTDIGLWNFAACSGLTAIQVDTNNAVYSSVGGVLFNKAKTTLVQCPAELAEAYSVPAGVTNLGYSAFAGCNVTSVTLSASVRGIGIYAFITCTNLAAIAADTNNPLYSDDGGVLFDKTKTTLANFPTGRGGVYAIPASVTHIGEYAFHENRKIACVDIPSSVTSIGTYAFGNCYALTNAPVPLSVTSIGERVFYGCAGLTRLPVPSSITNIGRYAFGRCEGLVNIVIPKNVTSVGSNAFWNCTNLERADFLGNAPSLGSSVFDGCAAGFTVYYLAGKAGFTSPTWNGYPSAVLSGAAILPPGIPFGTKYEAWVLTNAPGWNAVNFTAVPAEDFEKAWLINACPESNMQAKTDFRVQQFSVGENQILVTLGLKIKAQPKAGPVNGWLAVEGRNSMMEGWQTVAGQTAEQNKLSFTNGQAAVLFDKPASARFFRPGLQTDVPNNGSLPTVQQAD